MSIIPNKKYAISFQNAGLIDPIAITTFGVHVKESDSPIGYFGTGLKYAIAVLLRYGCSIEIYVGKKKHVFGLEIRNVRGQDFSVVTMNGKATGFTTELGKKWELWMAFRELYCNALDEGGKVTEGALKPLPECTTVVVKGSPLQECYRDKASIVLESNPIACGLYINIHPGESNYLYYRGVRIYELNRPTMYTYDFRCSIDLTEDRTAKHPTLLSMHIVRNLLALEAEHKNLIERSILADDGHWESNLEFDDAVSPSETALQVAEENRLNPRLNKTVHTLLVSHNRRLPMEPIELNEIRQKQLQRAIDFCNKLEYRVDKYPIVVTDQLKGGLLGLAEDGKIYIAPKTFDMGTKYLAATLLEEYLHLDTGFGDMTRDLQSHLFDMIMSLGEQIVGEPL